MPVLEAGEAEGRPYLAVAYVNGRSLAERLAAEGPLPVRDAVRVAAQVGSALDALHRAGLVHRDVKPANILLAEEGAAALTDFGLAKGTGYTVLTHAGQVVGTLDYLAPELIRGDPATPATDVYALGCVVFECVAGEPPFGSRSLFELGAAHLEEEPVDPAGGRTDAPPALGAVVLRALAKDPRDRPATATMYAHLLRAAAS
ncbi:MAG: serine/threonine protein kinase [Thermoleophilia bacterium]|nr:serine/threonine protein kinase [Thermoleophilia bacterium]